MVSSKSDPRAIDIKIQQGPVGHSVEKTTIFETFGPIPTRWEDAIRIPALHENFPSKRIEISLQIQKS